MMKSKYGPLRKPQKWTPPKLPHEMEDEEAFMVDLKVKLYAYQHAWSSDELKKMRSRAGYWAVQTAQWHRAP